MTRPRHAQAAVLPGLPDAAAACTPCKCFRNPSTCHLSTRPSSCLQDQIKAHITDLMLSAPPRVRAQLSEALSIISSHDFPAKWQVGVKGGMQHGAGARWGWGGWLEAAEGAWKVLGGAADAVSCCWCVCCSCFTQAAASQAGGQPMAATPPPPHSRCCRTWSRRWAASTLSWSTACCPPPTPSTSATGALRDTWCTLI